MRWAFCAACCGMVALTVAGLSAMESDSRVINSNGMSVRWRHIPEGVEFVVTGPTAGWVAIGFNDHDSIVGAELFMAAVQDGVGVAEHHRVVAVGLHPNVESMGVPSALSHAEVALDERGSTVAHFVVQAEYVPNVRLTRGEMLWLIIAYSVAPEFDHHSRIRSHVRITM
jgi:hypothetical protein